jgi:hypothetical protein
MSTRTALRCIAPLSAALLALPFAMWQNAWFEWANSLWLLEAQAEWVRTHGIPGPYLHGPDQIFYPIHLFYAGGLNGLLAYPSLIVGAWPVFLAVTVGAFVVAQQGVAWLARTLGVDRGLSGALGLGFVTTPYIVSLLYGRGAWTELVAVAGVTVAVAGASELLTSGAPRRRATVAVVAGVAWVAATHNLTLMFGLPLAGLTLLAAVRVHGTAVTPRAVTRVAAAAVVGGCLTAVILVPNLWLATNTLIAQPRATHATLTQLAEFHSTSLILRPWPAVPASQPAGSSVFVQTAVPLALWLLVALSVLRPRRRPSGRVVALAALGVAMLVAIVNAERWKGLPAALQTIQFPFRLVTWLALLIVVSCALVVARAGARRPRWLAPSLVAAVAVQTVTALVIAFGADGLALPGRVPLHHGDLTAGEVPGSFEGPGFAQPVQFRLRGESRRPRNRTPSPERLLDPPTRIALRGPEPAGTVVGSYVADSPLIGYDGDVRKIARDRLGFAVLEVLPHTGREWVATVRPRAPLPVKVGIAVSLLALLAVLGWLLRAVRAGRPANRA